MLSWDHSGEDVWFWRNSAWPQSGPAGITEVYNSLNDYDNDFAFAKFINADVNPGRGMILQANAMPSSYVTNWSTFPLFGWHSLNDWG
jgi:hypothetical protein